MPNLTIGFAIALIVLGIAGYIATAAVSLTALIPAFFGGVLLLLGLLARTERYRMHAMHGAALVAVLGLLGSIGALFQLPALFAGEIARPAPIVSRAIMALLTGTFLGLTIKSFVDARRRRAAGG